MKMLDSGAIKKCGGMLNGQTKEGGGRSRVGSGRPAQMFMVGGGEVEKGG